MIPVNELLVGDRRKHVEIDSKYYRPSEVDSLVGDASKAKRKLGWDAKIKSRDLVRLIVDADMAALKLNPTDRSLRLCIGNIKESSSRAAGAS